MSAYVTKDVRLPTGKLPDGKPDHLVMGFITEEDFGKGRDGQRNVRRRTWIHTSVLNPVLFQQVRPFMVGSYVCLEPVDLARRYRGPETPGESDATQGVPTPGLQSDPEAYVDPDNPTG